MTARALGAACFALSLGFATFNAAQAQKVEDFYRSAPVRLIVGYDNGGGYDVYARVLARHIGRHIPGNPAVAVVNMPGAGSLVSVNYLYNVAPKDGATFGTFARNIPQMAILGDSDKVKFDIKKFTWLGSSSSYEEDAFVLWVRKDAKIKTLDDARKPGGPQLQLGGTGEGSTGTDVPKILADTIGLNVRQITGYKGSGDLFLAIDRGEIEGRITDYSSVRGARPHYLQADGPVTPWLQFARRTRHPDLPNIPTARELAKDKDALAFIEATELPFITSRPFAAPPGIPAERADVLKKAFMAAHRDPLYLAEAEKLKIGVSPIGGDEVLALIDKMEKSPPEALDKVRGLYKPQK